MWSSVLYYTEYPLQDNIMYSQLETILAYPGYSFTCARQDRLHNTYNVETIPAYAGYSFTYATQSVFKVAHRLGKPFWRFFALNEVIKMWLNNMSLGEQCLQSHSVESDLAPTQYWLLYQTLKFDRLQGYGVRGRETETFESWMSVLVY